VQPQPPRWWGGKQKRPRCSASTAQEQNHRIIGWKRPLGSARPSINPTPPCLLNHVLKSHIHTVFEPLGSSPDTLPQATQLNHPCVINSIFTTNPNPSPIQAAMKKMNSIPNKHGTVRLEQARDTWSSGCLGLLCSADHGRASVLPVPNSSVFPIPQREHGYQGFHRTLKAVCLKNGVYVSRVFLRIDINESLAQPIYEKIDLCFGDVFR